MERREMRAGGGNFTMPEDLTADEISHISHITSHISELLKLVDLVVHGGRVSVVVLAEDVRECSDHAQFGCGLQGYGYEWYLCLPHTATTKETGRREGRVCVCTCGDGYNCWYG